MADLTCDEFVELVTAYLEGTLETNLVVEFDAHLAECPGCETYFDQMRETIVRLGEIPLESLSAAARDTLLTEFRTFAPRRG